MNVELLSTDSPLWREFLNKNLHDFYHLPEYVALEAKRMNGTAIAVYAEDNGKILFIPLVLRSIEHKKIGNKYYLDAVSPYGYPCPLINYRGLDIDLFLQQALSATKEVLISKDIVSVFVRFHPIISENTGFKNYGRLIYHGETVWCDLKLPIDEIWKQYRKGHKYDIKWMQKNLYQCQEDDDWVNFDYFIDKYRQTMDKVSANEQYYFSKDYFDDLRSALGDKLSLWIVRKEDNTIALGLFCRTNGIVQYHLSASPSNVRIPGTKLMIHNVILKEKERGNSVLHLGGGVGARSDTLFQFKSGFSKLRKPFYTWRWIINQDIYDALVKDWTIKFGLEADDITGYFPAYRKNISLQHLTY